MRRFIIKLSQQIDFVVSHFSACFSSRRLSKSIRLIVSCIVKKAFSWMFSQLLCGGLVYHLCGVCIVCVVVWCIICVVFASFVWWFGVSFVWYLHRLCGGLVRYHREPRELKSVVLKVKG